MRQHVKSLWEVRIIKHKQALKMLRKIEKMRERKAGGLGEGEDEGEVVGSLRDSNAVLKVERDAALEEVRELRKRYGKGAGEEREGESVGD